MVLTMSASDGTLAFVDLMMLSHEIYQFVLDRMFVSLQACNLRISVDEVICKDLKQRLFLVGTSVPYFDDQSCGILLEFSFSPFKYKLIKANL